jgi:hypothetical protein
MISSLGGKARRLKVLVRDAAVAFFAGKVDFLAATLSLPVRSKLRNDRACFI